MNKEFTFADGLAVQQEDLAQWKLRLNDATYALVESEAQRLNKSIKKGFRFGYNVWRGNQITEFICNLYAKNGTYTFIPS